MSFETIMSICAIGGLVALAQIVSLLMRSLKAHQDANAYAVTLIEKVDRLISATQERR